MSAKVAVPGSTPAIAAPGLLVITAKSAPAAAEFVDECAAPILPLAW